MLDVHPPHKAAHSWSDFFIHIATITIGLLIAVALEQGVEYLHHRHQVHDMEARLRQESDDNLAVTAFDIAGCQTLLQAVDTRLKVLADLRAWHNVPTPQPSFFAPVDAEAGRSRIRLNAVLALPGDAADLPIENIDALRTAFADYAANLGAYRYALTSYGRQIKSVLAGQPIDFRAVASREAATPP